MGGAASAALLLGTTGVLAAVVVGVVVVVVLVVGAVVVVVLEVGVGGVLEEVRPAGGAESADDRPTARAALVPIPANPVSVIRTPMTVLAQRRFSALEGDGVSHSHLSPRFPDHTRSATAS